MEKKEKQECSVCDNNALYECRCGALYCRECRYNSSYKDICSVCDEMYVKEI